MVEVAELKTDRLKLRQWAPGDYAPFAELNADPEVMEFYPNTRTKAESIAFAQKIAALIANRGWGFWAIELKAENRFIGFAGLHKPEVELPFTPCVEIGWRLSKKHWGHGYATEAARAALEYAFETLRLDEVVSFTSLLNTKSEAVMRRLNMVDTKQNYLHLCCYGCYCLLQVCVTALHLIYGLFP